MQINGVPIDNTYAEAFPTWISRIIITAVDREWALKAATEATGFATSAIGCPCEAGIETELGADETPDGRPGVAILICAAKKKLKEQVVERRAECVLTSPTTAVFDGLPDAAEKIAVKLHFFGDGYEYQKEVGGRKCWVIPIMEGEYIGEEEFGIVKGVAGGNFFVMGENQMAALMGAQTAVEAQDVRRLRVSHARVAREGTRVIVLDLRIGPARSRCRQSRKGIINGIRGGSPIEVAVPSGTVGILPNGIARHLSRARGANQQTQNHHVTQYG